jgi:alkylation response protein AidB-like acyl-CoA dehydrogenase
VPAQALGLAQAAVDEAWNYSQERRQFGQRICSFQAIRHSLSDCRTKLQACRLMVYWAASRVQSSEAAPEDTAMTKLFVTEAAKDIVLACQQIMGAYGYAEGFGMERYVRDVLALPIYGGSSAIQRNNIAKMLRLPKD